MALVDCPLFNANLACSTCDTCPHCGSIRGMINTECDMGTCVRRCDLALRSRDLRKEDIDTELMKAIVVYNLERSRWTHN